MSNHEKMPTSWDLGIGQFGADLISRYAEYSSRIEGPEMQVSSVSSLSNAGPNDITFCGATGAEAVELINKSNAGIIICANELEGKLTSPHSQLIFVNEPRFVFVRILNKVLKMNPSKAVAHPTSIGNNCRIGHNVQIGDNCVVGDNCIIHDGAILNNCYLGNNCVIHPNVTIGADGFAYERGPDLELVKFPHFGRVVIGDNVEICANCSITRGSLTNTLIDAGTKLDALVHVAHNVRIGKRCQLAAGVIIGGSAKIGDSCWLGLNSTINDHVKVGDNAIVAASAGVRKDVPVGDIVAGVPAQSIKNKLKLGKREYFLFVGLDSFNP
jgi:UDP-3-O-[3-hydroxymyristoyl] glucosamine N-acyltransferase